MTSKKTITKGSPKADNKAAPRTLVENRAARHNYHLLETFEVGVVLLGSEVKSLRSGGASIKESFAKFIKEELWLLGSHIAEYKGASVFNHDPKRPRKLMLHKKQLRKLLGQVSREGMTLVPVSLYTNARGRVKLQLALGKGKSAPDKRDDIADRDWQRRKQRLMRQ